MWNERRRSTPRNRILGSHPCTSREIDDVSFAAHGHLAFVESAVVFSWVDVAGGDVRAGIVPVIAEIVSTVFGFRFVQPERVHSQIGVVVLAFVPNECLRFGIGGVVELVRFLIHVGYIDAVFG